MASMSVSGQGDVRPGLSSTSYLEIFRWLPVPAVLTVQPEGRVADVNNSLLTQFGFTRKEVIGRKLADLGLFIAPGQKETLLKAFQQGGPRAIETDFGLKSGEVAPFLISGQELQIEGKPHLLMVFNPTARERELQDTLEETAVKFRAVFENSRDAIGVSRDGILEYVNLAYLKLFGYPGYDELRGRSLLDTIAPSHRAQIAEIVDRHATGRDVSHLYETRGLRKDGSEFDMEVQSSTYLLHGRLYTMGLLRDITGRKQAEQALRLSEQNFRSLVENSPSAIAVLKRNGEIRYANPTGMRIWNDPELVGKTIFDIFPSQYAARYNAAIRQVIDTRKPIQDEVDSVINGRMMSFQLSMEPLGDPDGGVTTLLLNAWDITERKQAERALQESEERFRQAFETSPDAISISRLDDGNYVLVNPGVTQMFGYAPEEVLGSTAADLGLWAHPEDRQRILEAVQQNETVRELEVQARRKDGTILDVALSAARLDFDGVPHLLGIVHDITQRKRVEQALREREALLRGFLENSRDAISITDEDGEVLEWSPAACALSGYGREESVGRYMWEVQARSAPVEDRSPALVENIKHVLLGALATGDNAFLNQPGDAEIERPDGSRLSVQTVAFSIPTTKGFRLGAVLRDNTDRKRMEQRLVESQRELAQAQHIAHMGSWSREEPGGLVRWSDEVYEIFAVPPGTPLDYQTFLSRVHPDDVPLVEQHTEQALATGNEFQYEFRIVLPGGETKTIVEIGHATRDASGRVTGLFGTTQDITERKRVERDLQRQLQTVRSLREIDQAISSSVGLDISLGTVLSHALNDLPVDAACILMLDPRMLTLSPVAGRGFRTQLFAQAIPFGLDRSFAGRAVLERRRFDVPDVTSVSSNPRFEAALAAEGFVSYYGLPLISKGVVQGVMEVFHRTPLSPDGEWLNLLEALAGQAAIAIDNATMFERLESSNRELAFAYEATIEGWSKAMDLRDKETEGHTQRVTETTLKLARAFGVRDAELPDIRRGALLHDIGKLGVPDQVLLKPGPLTDEEWVVMRKHPEFAYNMLAPIRYLHSALNIPYCHHEKWDGSGYPRGLKGEQIPLEARLFAVVDVWDALTSDRPYRAAWSQEKALDHIAAQAGSHFDPHVVAKFMDLVRRTD